MPARRKTSEELELSGSLRHEPGKYAGRKTPQPGTALSGPPEHLSSAQRKIWREIVKGAPSGSLTIADGIAVELVVRLVERLRAGSLSRAAEINALNAALSKLGLNPTDRARINLVPQPKPVEDDPWNRLLAHAR